MSVLLQLCLTNETEILKQKVNIMTIKEVIEENKGKYTELEVYKAMSGGK